jgi:hypothetical protein
MHKTGQKLADFEENRPKLFKKWPVKFENIVTKIGQKLDKNKIYGENIL